ncbi:MAG: DNA recombination protein RmuC [Gemmiger sp.]
MEILLAVLLVLAVTGDILLALVARKLMGENRRERTEFRELQADIEQETEVLADQMRALQGEISRTTVSGVRDLGAMLAETQRQTAAAQSARLDSIDRAGAARQKAANDAVNAQLALLENRLKNLETTNAAHMTAMRAEMSRSLAQMRADNAQKLEEIRGTVDEKLQNTLQQRISESFQSVSRQLEQVYKGLGEMQSLAADVGGLKQVLSGVKTRGILGEVQLGAILQEILAPGQYETNAATVPGSANRVEYAIKLPGQDGPVYLPIDAKFPGDTYTRLQQALEQGNPNAVASARKQLALVLRAEARDIHEKYIEVPYTTNFGILFLPFEGLYAEVVNSGIMEQLQRDYQVNVAGPSTMAALLNALQMGFQTLAIQKRSGEVWTVLGAVKTEFEKFGAGLRQMQRHLNQTGSDLEELIGTRSRAINRKLESVQMLDPGEAREILGLTEDPSAPPPVPGDEPRAPRLRRTGLPEE